MTEGPMSKPIRKTERAERELSPCQDALRRLTDPPASGFEVVNTGGDDAGGGMSINGFTINMDNALLPTIEYRCSCCAAQVRVYRVKVQGEVFCMTSGESMVGTDVP